MFLVDVDRGKRQGAALAREHGNKILDDPEPHEGGLNASEGEYTDYEQRAHQ